MTSSSSVGSDGDAPDYLVGLRAVLDPASSETSSGTGAGLHGGSARGVLVSACEICKLSTLSTCTVMLGRCISRAGLIQAHFAKCCQKTAYMHTPSILSSINSIRVGFQVCSLVRAESAGTRTSTDASGVAMSAVLTALEGLSREVSRLRVCPCYLRSCPLMSM